MSSKDDHRFSKGYALRVEKSDTNHHFGGPHSIKGAGCPNCEKPLIQHFVIDCSDVRLGLEKPGLETIPLLYCMRCELSWYDFVYDLHSPDSISIVQAYTDKNNDRSSILKEWNEVIGVDEFPKQQAELLEIPADIKILFDKWNKRIDFTSEEEDRISAFYADYLKSDGKDYFADDAINQLCGRSLLIQGLDDPICGKCEKHMPFLASFKSEKLWNLIICWGPVQIVFFFCPECKRIHVQHSI